MPRPREFDEDDVVARATRLFWRRGFHATGVRDLFRDLELSPSTLYRTFGDKRGLFLRALGHYRATESAAAHDELLRPGPVRAVLRAWLLRMVDIPAEGMAEQGCFVVNTATELGVSDADVVADVQAAFEVTREALRRVLERGHANGELAADFDVSAAVDVLFTFSLGLRVRSRAGDDPGSLAGVVDGAVAVLLAGEPTVQVTPQP